MANEAAIRVRQEDAVDFTVADGTGIEKGAILGLADPRTASLAATSPLALAGIAAREKIASDGRTQLAVYRKGIFDLSLSGTITAGDPVMIAPDVATYPNHVADGAAAEASGSAVLGTALEDGTNGEVIQVAVNI